MPLNHASVFWSWFVANEHLYRDIEVREKEQLLENLLGRLQTFCAQLWFEIGGGLTGPRELVITAEGRVEAFPLLLELTRAAPEITGWQVVAFKQPQGFDFVTHYEDIVVAPAATWFLPLFAEKDPGSLGLRIAFAHFEQKKKRQFLAAAHVMLEAGLGELAAAQEVDHVEVCQAPSSPEGSGYRILRSLREYLNGRSRMFEGGSV
ncbi:MAG: hypothetical protein JSR66_00615 [Proteobacteria bacterium]|nr:hypothetical protein [Pseudomonadota bacterium]